MMDGLRRGYANPAFAAMADADVRDGRHRNPTGDPRYFTTSYFHRPEELAMSAQKPAWRLKCHSPWKAQHGIGRPRYVAP